MITQCTIHIKEFADNDLTHRQQQTFHWRQQRAWQCKMKILTGHKTLTCPNTKTNPNWWWDSLVKQIWLKSSFAWIKDFNGEFRLRLVLEQLDAESLRSGDEEGRGIGDHVFSISGLLEIAFSYIFAKNPKNLLSGRIVHLFPGGKEPSSLLKKGKVLKVKRFVWSSLSVSVSLSGHNTWTESDLSSKVRRWPVEVT